MINLIKNNVDHITLIFVAAATIITSLVFGITGFAIIVFPAMLLYYYAHKWQIAREIRLLMEKYARQVDDIFVYAEDEQDDTVKARAMEEVHLLKDSQNAEYAAGKLKVIIMYYEHNPVEDMEEVVAMPPINPQLHRYLVMAPSFDRYCEVAEEWAHRHHGTAHKAKAADRWASDWTEAEILKQRG
jgi:hypothetical protein